MEAWDLLQKYDCQLILLPMKVVIELFHVWASLWWPLLIQLIQSFHLHNQHHNHFQSMYGILESKAVESVSIENI